MNSLAKKHFFETFPNKHFQEEFSNVYAYGIKEQINSGKLTEEDMYVDTLENFYLRVKNRSLNYSNDYLTDILLEKIFHNIPQEISKEITNTFVGVSVFDSSLNAYAYQQFDDSSYLIVYTTSLMNKISIVLCIITCYICERNYHFNLNTLKELFLEQLTSDYNEMINIQEIIDDLLKTSLIHVREDFDRIFGKLHEYSTCFVLGHEIGHHFFLHTKNIDLKENLNILSENIKNNHINELYCDKFSAFITFETFAKDQKNSALEIIGIVSALLALTLEENFYEHSTTHPSFKNRFDMVFNYFNERFPDYKLKEHISDFFLCCDLFYDKDFLDDRWWENYYS
ncbi:hypothetical protein [Haliovirga abyssi]|uniref:Peptidase M48 domain-containing protein n=1 Tax=Haliovirga abyssi TaxID=2996794 RepID=A0AAU9DBI9_9FUSO|nr:hypothetical protein [Haliovirga abyssi]BDU49478.1 hypothetical protein HLVA_00470 [Haliovirga abyssi]